MMDVSAVGAWCGTSPQLGRKLLHSGNFSLRINYSEFPDTSQTLLFWAARKTVNCMNPLFISTNVNVDIVGFRGL